MKSTMRKPGVEAGMTKTPSGLSMRLLASLSTARLQLGGPVQHHAEQGGAVPGEAGGPGGGEGAAGRVVPQRRHQLQYPGPVLTHLHFSPVLHSTVETHHDAVARLGHDADPSQCLP